MIDLQGFSDDLRMRFESDFFHIFPQDFHTVSAMAGAGELASSMVQILEAGHAEMPPGSCEQPAYPTQVCLKALWDLNCNGGGAFLSVQRAKTL